MKKLLTLLVTIQLFALSVNAQGPAGTLDLSFDTDGIAIYNPGTLHDVVYGIDVQTDQKIVFAGVGRITSTTGFTSDLVIGRLKTDGSRDSSFANNGIFNLASTGGSVFGYDVKVQPDGKIIACGGYSVTASNTDFIVIRLNTDGSPDTSFGGGDGIAIIPIGSSEDYAHDLELQPDGKIVLAGESAVPGFVYGSGIVMRLLPDGTIDNTFGTGGKTAIQLSSASTETFKCMELMPSGRVIAAGYSYVNNTEYVFMAGFTPDGVLDSTFANNGVFTGSAISQAFDLAIDGNNIYLAGRISNTGGYDLALSCFDTTGAANLSFGQNGTVYANYNPVDCALGVTVQSDGKIICAGTSGLGTFGNRDMLVTRYLPTGALDPAFAGTGYAIIPVSPNFEEANVVALQADFKILVAGFASFSNNEMVFLRLYNDLTVGLNATETENQWSMYPVPLSGSSLWISSKVVLTGSVNCQLVDFTGRILSQTMVQNPGKSFELALPAGLPSGAYLIRLRSENTDYCRAVIK